MLVMPSAFTKGKVFSILEVIEQEHSIKDRDETKEINHCKTKFWFNTRLRNISALFHSHVKLCHKLADYVTGD